MRKSASLLLIAVMLCTMLAVFAVPAFAEELSEITVEIFPDGQDTYSDGTPVLDDEIYVIVWTKSPDTEVNFDDTFKSDDDMKILVNAPMAKGGCCPRILFQFDESYYRGNSLDTGYFRLFSTNLLRRKENSAIAFEIRETKVTVGNYNNNSFSTMSVVPGNFPINPTVVTPKAVMPKVDKIVFAGDWIVTYFTYTSGIDQNESLIIISPKKETQRFYQGSLGSILSEGSLTIICTVAAAIVFGLCGFFIGKAAGKRKKNTVPADGEESDEE